MIKENLVDAMVHCHTQFRCAKLHSSSRARIHAHTHHTRIASQRLSRHSLSSYSMTFFAIIQHVADLDFPDRWPSLLPKIVATISAPDAARCYGGLMALLALAQNYGCATLRGNGCVCVSVSVSV